MGFLLQNINVVKVLKNRIDKEGASLIRKDGVFSSASIDYFTSVIPVLASWKTAIVGINDDTFYIGLNIASSFDYQLSTTLPTLEMCELKKLIYYDNLNKHFTLRLKDGVSMPLDQNLERANGILANAVLDYNKAEYKIKNFSYKFSLGNCSPSVEKVIKDYISNSKSLKYLPLFLITTNAKYKGTASRCQAVSVSLHNVYTWYPIWNTEGFLKSVEASNFLGFDLLGCHLLYNPLTRFIPMAV